MPVHRRFGAYTDEHVQQAGIADDRKDVLFRAAAGRTGMLTEGSLGRTDVFRMTRRRAREAGIRTPIGCHAFRATGITNYLENGGTLCITTMSTTDSGHVVQRGRSVATLGLRT